MDRLSFDIARCNGVGYEENGVFEWRLGCEDCLRRTVPGRDKYQDFMFAPEIIVFECEYYISPK
jgi:hypothetical protein